MWGVYLLDNFPTNQLCGQSSHR